MSTISPKTEGLVTVRHIVMSVLNRLNDYTLKQYKRLTQIALEGFSELNLWHIGAGMEVVYLHMSAAKTVNLPSDYVNYIKIGIPINGKLRVLTNHDQILLPRVFDDTGEAVGNTDNDTVTESVSNAIFFAEHWKNGAFIGGLYGLPGALDQAFYRVDMERRQIIFSGEVDRSEVVLEYISSGLKTDGSSMIPREVIPTLRNYILWQMVENDSRIAYNEKERRKREYNESLESLRSFTNAFTKDEYLRMCYSTYRQSPKR